MMASAKTTESTAKPDPKVVEKPPEKVPEAKPAAPKAAAPKAAALAPTKKPAAKPSGLVGAELAAAAIMKSKYAKKPDPGTRLAHTVVASGSAGINDVIGGSLSADGKNRVCPGYPRRRITEVYGAESSGKTTAALQAIAEVQKAGGWALFLDYERAVDHGYARKIGVSYDKKKMLLYSPDTAEEGLDYIYLAILAGVDLIVVDSVAAMIPKKELEAKVDAEAQIGLQARLFARQIPKVLGWMDNPKAKAANPLGPAIILINQERATIQAQQTRGTNKNTTGGKALKYYVSLRLHFSRIKSETVMRKDKFTGVEAKVPFGNVTRVKVVKNKLDGKEGHSTEIFIRFGFGIDELYSMIEAGITNKLIKKDSGWFTYKGERFQGREKLRVYLKENPKVYHVLREEVLSIIQSSAIVTDEELDEADQLVLGMEANADDDEDDDEPEDAEVTEEDIAASGDDEDGSSGDDD